VNPFEDDEDAWPDEPEEFDPDSLGPEVSDPASNVDSGVETSLGATADVDDEVFRAFWGSVVFLNVALGALAIGALLVYFRGDWGIGGPALLVGTVAAIFTARFYLQGKQAVRETDGEREGSDTEPTGERSVDTETEGETAE
jgi:hypothetical protein